jgi:hypothetical protein
MVNPLYQSLLSELSETERPIFEDLLIRIEQLNGDLSALSEEDKAKLSELVTSHNVSQNKIDLNSYIEPSAAETSVPQISSFTNISDIKRPTETEFGAYLLDNINESLCQGGASTADAIRYAFHNKWMPDNLKNRDICEDLYYRYLDDIEQANKSIQGNQVNKDTVVAVGLAWFTTLYLCYQVVEAEGEI